MRHSDSKSITTKDDLVNKRSICLGPILSGLLTFAAYANDDHDSHHQAPVGEGTSSYPMPTEPGQSAFATIAEIVTILQDNPDTDWSKVSIRTLREHLVDMDLVTLDAEVATEMDVKRVSFSVSGVGRTRQAIKAMVLAHAEQLRLATDWNVIAQETEGGALLTIEVGTTHEQQKVFALGFFGVMSIGAHHQEHHLMMALGDDAHG